MGESIGEIAQGSGKVPKRRKASMAPIHGHEYLVFERLQERRHEQEQLRWAHPCQPYPRRTQRLMSRLGTFFVALGTKMQRIEQHGERTI